MAVRVRVQNFQSIKDAEVLIEGLTVVTGPNNSGKTAMMRAVRGVFTNPAAGPLIRHGEAYLSVSLTFDDGTVIVWEKGWEKPGQKGKSINRYMINGILIQGVGRGVPPEVEALGVREIPASTERVWPQIADQFDGTLFLLNRPGSAVAEALSDVEKVGRLTDALKLSEKDQRAAESEIKIRRADVEALKKEVAAYDGLNDVTDAVSDLEGNRLRVTNAFNDLQVATGLGQRLNAARDSAQALAGFSVTVPALSPKGDLGEEIRTIRALSGRFRTAMSLWSTLRNLPTPVVPDGARALKIQTVIQTIVGLKTRRAEAIRQAALYEVTLQQTIRESAEAVDEVQTLLADLGVCPTCNTVHSGETHP